MSEEYDKAIEGLQGAMAEGANIMLDDIRRKALYPTIAEIEKQTRRIMLRQAALPVNQTDADKVLLIRHIEMLKQELNKKHG